MSTEVECINQVDSGLTAESQNTSGGAHLQREHEEQGQKQRADGPNSEAAKSPTDMHKNCNENDKENDQSSSSSSSADLAAETVKRKVVEAPPPKVNPWTKRTTGRMPSNNINSSSQEKGELFVCFNFI